MLHNFTDMNKILYKYIKIELDQFAIFEDHIKNNQEEVQLETSSTFQYDQENHVICNTITVTFFNLDIPLMRAVSKSYFQIHTESLKQMTDDEHRIIFPQSVLVQFASLNYGTLRGMVHLKTLNTKLSKYILPPIFFNEIITTDLEID